MTSDIYSSILKKSDSAKTKTINYIALLLNCDKISLFCKNVYIKQWYYLYFCSHTICLTNII